MKMRALGSAVIIAVYGLLLPAISSNVDETCDVSSGICGLSRDILSIETVIPKGANSDGTPRETTRECIDRYPECLSYAQSGECDQNPG